MMANTTGLTGVGMNRGDGGYFIRKNRVPHGRGDEPNFMLALSEGTGRGGEHVQFCLWKTKKGRTFMQPFFKTNPPGLTPCGYLVRFLL